MLTRTLVSRLRCAASISFAICLIFPTQSRSQQVTQRTPIQKFEATLVALASASPDDCGWDQPTRRFNGDTSKLEDELFQDADEAVLNALNSTGANPAKVIERTLDSLRTTAERVNHDWPADRRFHYDLLTIQPVFVVVYHIRSRSTWSVFAVPADASWPKKGKNTEWKQVGEDDFRWQDPKGDQRAGVYSIQRGPSGLARFLSKSDEISCGDGITGLTWKAYEWNPAGIGSFETVIERTGVEKRDDDPPYQTVGKLRTTGPLITLPYCENSAVDLYVDALLCSVDRYDLSGDVVRFISSETNRPDLDTVAKVVQYADARDYEAVLAYSASPQVARKMVEEMPPGVAGNGSGEDYPPIRGDHQTIDIEGLHFELEKHDGRWVVVRFTLDPDQ
ncbi:MAG: hypothetical protein ACLP00_28225 [Terracidiphilus sp.]